MIVYILHMGRRSNGNQTIMGVYAQKEDAIKGLISEATKKHHLEEYSNYWQINDYEWTNHYNYLLIKKYKVK